MGISSKLIEHEKKMIIMLDERFDFSCHGEFRDAYQSIDLSQFEITIDFAKTEYIDSAAIGMLLVLREHAGGDKAKITFRSCRPSVRQIIEITRLDKLFKFSN